MKQNTAYIIAIPVSIAIGIFIGRTFTQNEDIPTDLKADTAIEQNSNTKTSTKLLPQFSLDEIKSRALKEASKPRNQRDSALLSLLYNEWIQHSPMDALSFAKENNRMDWLMEGLRLAGRENPADALAWIENEISSPAFRVSLEEAVFRGIVKEDPQEALARVNELNDGPRRNQLLSAVLREWTKHDPDKVFDWFETQEPTPFLSNSYASIMHNYVSQDPKASSKLITAMDGHPFQASLAEQAAKLLAKEDPQLALEWTNDLPAESKDAAVKGIVEQWAYSSDSEGALEYVMNLPVSKQNKKLFDIATKMMAYADHEALQQQMDSFDDNQRNVATSHLAALYGAYNPEIAKEWLSTIPEGPHSDYARSAVIKSISSQDYQKALELSNDIVNESERQVQILGVIRSMGKNDPEAASLALQDSPHLSEKQKEMVQKSLDEILNSPGWIPTKKNYVFPER